MRLVIILIGTIRLKRGDILLPKRFRRSWVLASLVDKGSTSGVLHIIDRIFRRGETVVAEVDEIRLNRLLVGVKTTGNIW